MKKLISMLLTLSLVFGLSASAFAAEGKMTVEEAEKYLLDFVKEEVNEDGKIITTTYEFESDKDLQEVATFIAENGAKAFQQKIDENISLKDVDDSDNGQFRRLPSSPIISKTVKGDGTHTVKCEMSGLVKFNKVGNVEYLAKLSCKVDVKKGNVIAINSTSFDMPYVSTGDQT